MATAMSDIEDIKLNISGICRSLQTKDEAELIQWICPLDANSWGRVDTVLKNRWKGTGTWLYRTEEYKAWQEKAGCFWLHGPSGSGKTILAAGLIKDVTIGHPAPDSLGSLALYFMFDLRDAASNVVAALYDSLIHQLLKMSSPGMRHVRELESRHYSKLLHEQPTTEERLELLIKLIREVCQLKRVMLVVDGCDECIDFTDPINVRFFEQLIDISLESNRDTPRDPSQLDLGFKIFLTTKYLDQIPRELTRFHVNMSLIHNKDVTADIRMYARENVEAMGPGALSAMSAIKDLEHKVIERIVESSGDL
jgi:hypothetical protein